MSPLQLELRRLLKQRKKIEAIKLYRRRMGGSLHKAKEAVEALERGQPLLGHGDHEQAVKLYCKRTGASEREARAAVRRLTRRHRLGGRSWGCGATVFFMLVVVVGGASVWFA